MALHFHWMESSELAVRKSSLWESDTQKYCKSKPSDSQPCWLKKKKVMNFSSEKT